MHSAPWNQKPADELNGGLGYYTLSAALFNQNGTDASKWPPPWA